MKPPEGGYYEHRRGKPAHAFDRSPVVVGNLPDSSGGTGFFDCEPPAGWLFFLARVVNTPKMIFDIRIAWETNPIGTVAR
jgi:hypothetical protein